MDKVNDWIKGCFKKQKFETKQSAEHVKVRSEQKYNTTYRIYKCRHCTGFHLTSKQRVK